MIVAIVMAASPLILAGFQAGLRLGLPPVVADWAACYMVAWLCVALSEYCHCTIPERVAEDTVPLRVAAALLHQCHAEITSLKTIVYNSHAHPRLKRSASGPAAGPFPGAPPGI